MGLWEAQLQDHATTIAIRSAAGSASGLGEVPEDVGEVADRVVHSLRYLVGLLDLCDPRLLTPGMLDGPLSAARTVEAELESFESNRDGIHITQANAATDQLLDAIRSWPGFTSSTDEVAAARTALETVETASAEAAAARADELRSLEEIVAGIRGEFADVKATFDQSMEAARAASGGFEASTEQRVADLTATVEAQKSRLDQAIAEFQSQFSAAQEERRRAAEEVRISQASEFQVHIAKLANDSEVEVEARRTEAQSVLGQITEYRDQAARVTEAIGITGMAEGFRKDADDQKKAADRLRLGALASLLCTAGLGIWAASATHSGKFQASVFVARILVSAAVASIGTYLIIQSAHHRERERRARKLELELASIDPYLALMPPEVAVEVKRKLADAWFGQPIVPIDESGGAHAASIPIAEFIQAVIKLGSK